MPITESEKETLSPININDKTPHRSMTPTFYTNADTRLKTLVMKSLSLHVTRGTNPGIAKTKG